MSYSVFLVVGGCVLLYGGAEGLVRGSTALALRLRIAPLVVGLTVVAFGTSSPELVVSVQAAVADRGAIALGNVVGSNIANVALILGLAVVIRPAIVQAQLLRLDVPVMIGCALLLDVLLQDGLLGRPEGALFTLGLVAYVAFNVWQARREGTEVQQEFSEEFPPPQGALWRDVLFVVAGLGLLVGGAHLLVDGAVTLSRRFGMSEAFIGLTVVAVGTSLPELATTVVAAVKGEGDLAIGNVVGSNVFNILGILGVSALVRPLTAQGISMIDLGVMTFMMIVLFPFMYSDFRLVRWEGALLLVFYIGYIIHLVP